MTQAELAGLAGVSRQLVGAVESGRHLPRVDAALALSRALGVSPESLFASDTSPVDVLTGGPPGEGEAVRVGMIGVQVVTSPPLTGGEGWGPADGAIESGRVVGSGISRPSVVVAGCEPGLETLESMLRQEGIGAMAVVASSASAVNAMTQGRAHAAVVHAPEGEVPDAPPGLVRFGLTGWSVGLALPPGMTSGWWDLVVSGGIPVVQREPSAAAQQSFLEAVGGEVPGPRAGGHLSAGRHGICAGIPALTIEPVSAALGVAFHPLAHHRVELWVDDRWLGERGVEAMLTAVTGEAFRRRLEQIGGYHLEELGSSTG